MAKVSDERGHCATGRPSIADTQSAQQRFAASVQRERISCDLSVAAALPHKVNVTASTALLPQGQSCFLLCFSL